MHLHIRMFSRKIKSSRDIQHDFMEGVLSMAVRLHEVTLYSLRSVVATEQLHHLKQIAPFLSASKSPLFKNVYSNKCSARASLSSINTFMRSSDKKITIITQYKVLLA